MTNIVMWIVLYLLVSGIVGKSIVKKNPDKLTNIFQIVICIVVIPGVFVLAVVENIFKILKLLFVGGKQ